jgi:PAS domain-containing protein
MAGSKRRTLKPPRSRGRTSRMVSITGVEGQVEHSGPVAGVTLIGSPSKFVVAVVCCLRGAIVIDIQACRYLSRYLSQSRGNRYSNQIDDCGNGAPDKLAVMSAPSESPSTLAPEQAQAIAELRKHAEILRLVQANLPICIWAIDLQGIFTYHEGKGLSAAGVKPGQFLGMNIFGIDAPVARRG